MGVNLLHHGLTQLPLLILPSPLVEGGEVYSSDAVAGGDRRVSLPLVHSLDGVEPAGTLLAIVTTYLTELVGQCGCVETPNSNAHSDTCEAVTVPRVNVTECSIHDCHLVIGNGMEPRSVFLHLHCGPAHCLSE